MYIKRSLSQSLPLSHPLFHQQDLSITLYIIQSLFSLFFLLHSLVHMDQETQERYAENGKVMLGASILLFLTILLLIFLHTCRPLCFRRRRRRHRVRADSAAVRNDRLHPSVLTFLPAFTYSSDTHRRLEDCAVCLSEFEDGDEGRVLPNCNHAFHSHCIDAWFRSHSNCPLCRTPFQKRVEPVQPERMATSSVEPCSVGFSSFPAPIGCPRKSLELVGIIVELEDWRRKERFGSGIGSRAPDTLTPPCD